MCDQHLAGDLMAVGGRDQVYWVMNTRFISHLIIILPTVRGKMSVSLHVQ